MYESVLYTEPYFNMEVSGFGTPRSIFYLHLILDKVGRGAPISIIIFIFLA